MTRSLRSSPERPCGRGRHLLPALLLAGAALLAPARGQSAPVAGAGGVPARARAILSDPRYQTRLPKHETPQDLDEGRPLSFPGSGAAEAAVPVISAGAELMRIVFLVLLV
ncbi:MAG TPA: hypothetical protein VFC23_13860, partial [Thermoanaerobaculia bacterium]|nr:hypothetical protein [Thermoanaerobaculia bacterium]